jgi:hypothetical protein
MSSQQLPLFEFAESVNIDSERRLPADSVFSDYVVYVDESGDHSLTNINKDYPVFVLALCVFHKRHYAEKIIPALEKFKFNYFGHDAVVLHERDIRKQLGNFTLLTDRALQQKFMEELTQIISAANFVLISCVIDKSQISKELAEAGNPYHTAVGICLEGLYDFLSEKGQAKRLTHVLVECRGRKEDAELELEFRRMCDGANRKNTKLPFEILFVDKKANSSGLQLADLVARPIGNKYLRPGSIDRAFDALKMKFFCEGGRNRLGVGYEGWGLTVVPAQKSERPR